MAEGPRIAAATATAQGKADRPSGPPTLRVVTTGAPITAQMIEDAMTNAVIQCGVEGITDPETILARKMAARAEITGG